MDSSIHSIMIKFNDCVEWKIQHCLKKASFGGGSDFCNQIIRLSFKEILNQTLKSMMFIAFNIYLMFKFDIYLI